MASELPFFKFEPNQWDNGNIQICSREDKGLFMDLCSMYWSRLGDLPIKLAVQKLCAGNASAFDSLIEENIFAVIDGYVCIGFLNEQLDGFKNTSRQNSQNAKDGWEKRRKNKTSIEKNATASNPQSETHAIREEKIRIDKKKEENNIDDRKLKFALTLEPFLEKYGRPLLKEFYEYWTEPNKSGTKFKQEMEKTWSLERRLTTWDNNDRKFIKEKSFGQKEKDPVVAGRMTESAIQKGLTGWD